MNTPNRRSDCPINVALEMFGDRWSLLILRDMLLLGKYRYGEFLSTGEGISTNILASRLKQLESHGLIEKLVGLDDRKASQYLPTDLGMSLLPVLLAVIAWGLEHQDDTGVPDFVRQRLREDPARLVAECEARLHNDRRALSGE